MALHTRRIIVAISLWLVLAACRSQPSPEQRTAPEADVSGLPQDTLVPVETIALPDTLRYTVTPREWYAYWMLRTDTLRTDTVQQTSMVQQYYTKLIHRITPDGRIELSVRIDTLIASFTMPADTAGSVRRFSYDSRKAEDRRNPDFAHLTALLGTEVRMLVTPDGRIDSVFALRTVVQRLRRLSPDTLPATLDPFLERQIAEQMYRPLQQEYLAFPTGPIDSTRSWRHEYQDVIASLFPTQNTAEYRILGARTAGERPTLEIAARLRSHVQKRQIQEGQLQAELRRESLSGSGRILIDARQGYTIAKEVHVVSRFEVLVRDTLQKQEESFRHFASSHVQFRLAQRGWLKN